jgi:hypothetical protein
VIVPQRSGSGFLILAEEPESDDAAEDAPLRAIGRRPIGLDADEE